MKTEQVDSFSSTVSINPYDNTYIKSISSFLSQVKKPEYAKAQFVNSYLNTQDYISNQIEISKNIPDEDIFDALTIKVYDELGLDQTIEYQMQYIETFHNLDSEHRFFQVFLVDPQDIQNIYQESIKELKYIDFITPSPLLIKSLYTKEIIQDNGIHSFIYFNKNDAFLAIYSEQEFIYNKSLKYSFIQMHDRFCELYGEQITYEEFINFLCKENLKYTTSKYKEFILQLYKEIFSDINNILTYTKKAFNIEKISHIYIGAQIDLASKLYEISEVELGIEASDFNFDYGFESNNLYIDQMHALLQLTSILSNDDKYLCNFSTFNRPPKFKERDSGKIIFLTIISFLIAFAYPATFWILSYLQEVQYGILEQEYSVIHTQKIDRQTTINIKEAEKTKVSSLLKEEKDVYTSKKNTLLKIHDVKVNYPMKAKLISAITQDLNNHHVNINQILYNQDKDTKNFIFTLASKQDKKITKLLEYLTKKYDRKFKFFLENIKYDKEEKLYYSELKVKVL